MKISTRNEMSNHEATGNPIFLFQYKRYFLKDVPFGYHLDDDCNIVKDDAENKC